VYKDLLEQAVRLAKLDAKRPKQANLRRAISSAYYALFQLNLPGNAGDRDDPQFLGEIAPLKIGFLTPRRPLMSDHFPPPVRITFFP
jgi:hypothetical protein